MKIQIHRAFDPAERIGAFWCSLVHDSLMWPIHGQYECRTCGRHHPVPWAGPNATETAQIRREPLPSFRSALLPLLIMVATVLASPVRAAGTLIFNSSPGAHLAFARYIAGQEEASPWHLETIEIEASLPALAKKGRLRAVRRLLPLGRSEYLVLELAGDQTVKQQVIVRYLSAEERAASIPPSSVAITPVNYKFHYKCLVKNGNRLAYAFLITPRKKREGLIKGELWLDSETGMAVRQSGYLVKRPSVFVKRIDVTRETSIREGVVETRITHLSVDTRLVGRAELFIEERPFAATDNAAPGGCCIRSMTLAESSVLPSWPACREPLDSVTWMGNAGHLPRIVFPTK